MRVNGPNGTDVATASAATRRANGAGGFTPSESNGPQTAGATIGLRTIGGIDALIALQGMEDPTERRRRRRAVKHGRRALDAVEELKLALLSGSLESSALLGLKAVAPTSRRAPAMTSSTRF
jgi:Class II flagellar assembly regulator